MFGFLTGHTWPIALDLGGDSVKLLQMKRSGSVVHATGCSKWRYPEDVRNDPAQRRQAAVAAVRDMLKKGRFKGRDVVSSLSCPDLAIKNIRLPSMNPQDLDKAIRSEARERFGFDVAPDQVSFLHAGPVRQGNESREEVIVMAAPRNVIEDHLAMLSEMGLKAKHIDAEPIALFRVFERYLRRRSDEQAVSVVVDLGFRASRVIVARGRQILFVKSIDIGGARFNEAVAKQLNVSPVEAVELRTRGSRPADEAPVPEAEEPQAAAPEAALRDTVNWTLRDAIRGEMDLLGKEIALCLRYCSVTFRGVRPEAVTLCGGEAHDPAVVALLAEQLNMPCHVGHPLRGIDVSAVDLGGDRRGRLAEWTLCAGLASRGVEMPPLQEDDDGNRDRLSA